MTLRVLKNHALISPDTVKSEQGGIHVPEFIQRVGRPSGILLQAATEDKTLLEAIGKRVLIRTGALFEYEGRRYLITSVDQVLAIVDGDWTVKIVDPIERCAWCKSAGEGNMMLDHSGYCIQCHKNRYGQLQESTVTHPKAAPLTDEEREAFGGTVEQRLNRFNATGKVYSFPGQVKRSAADVPKPKLYVAPQRNHIVPQNVEKAEGRIVSAASLKKRSRYEQE